MAAWIRARRIGTALSLSVGAATVAGCTGIPYKLANVEPNPARYEVLGPGAGVATGLMVLNLIPVGQNDKLERAVEFAIRSRGGDELIDVSVQESWFWAYVLNGYRVRVNGTVVKNKP